MTDADNVGWQFIHQYYSQLNANPAQQYLFYTRESTLVHSDDPSTNTAVAGQQAIKKRFAEHNFNDCKVIISTVDCLPSEGHGVLVQVLGEMSNKGQFPRRFVQTFLLSSNEQGFFVKNDVLRFLDEPRSPSPPATRAECSVEHEPVPLNVVDKLTPETLTNGVPSAEPVAAVANEETTAGPQSELSPESVAKPTELTSDSEVATHDIEDSNLRRAGALSKDLANEKSFGESTVKQKSKGRKPTTDTPWNESPEGTSTSRAATPKISTGPKSTTDEVSPTIEEAPQTTNGSTGTQVQQEVSTTARKPSRPTHSAYVRDVPKNVDEKALRGALGWFGRVVHFQCEAERGRAFVDFADSQTLERALVKGKVTVNDVVIPVERRKRRADTAKK